ncbi:MAG: hypothetical protein HYY20_09875 [Candidatus Tectomicrobia bacterium]|uniref:Carbohydrate-binding domain-containing protein n=1 Tax=Tectimicrobiota bacterium TaxID=2528274 RepID=A0A932CRA3_UNCTE|nr:hypothetical protein [Candidatus Tectomicrobia bacterium]
MTDQGPILANLMLSGIWDENVRTEESRRLVSPLAAAARGIAQPLRIEVDTFTGATLPLKLVNDADQPLQVSARFRASDQLRPDPYAIQETIPPNSVEVIDLKLEPRRPLSTPEVHPLLLDVSLSYEMPEGPKLEMQRLQPVAIDQISPSPKRKAPVVVDGKLDEWGELPHLCERPVQVRGQKDAWQGPDDASFRFATAHDDQYLYVAIRVKDERVLPMQGPVGSQDSLEVRLDARPDPTRSEGRGQNEMEDFLLIATAPDKSAEQTYVFGRDDGRMPKGIQIATVLTATGYECEIAIPVSYLNEVQEEPWKAFRLNIAQNDRDDPAGPHVQIHWRPDWRTDESYVGSGTFVRR